MPKKLLILLYKHIVFLRAFSLLMYAPQFCPVYKYGVVIDIRAAIYSIFCTLSVE